MAGTASSSAKTNGLAGVEISESDLELMSDTVLVARLMAGGVSRLTAERFVEIQRGTGESGRARPHAVARR